MGSGLAAPTTAQEMSGRDHRRRLHDAGERRVVVEGGVVALGEAEQTDHHDLVLGGEVAVRRVEHRGHRLPLDRHDHHLVVGTDDERDGRERHHDGLAVGAEVRAHGRHLENLRQHARAVERHPQAVLHLATLVREGLRLAVAEQGAEEGEERHVQLFSVTSFIA